MVDETLWTIDPLGQRDDENLSVLVGRPLAVVRARLNLRLRGLAYAQQDWWNTFKAGSYNDKDSQEKAPAQLAGFDGGIKDRLWPVRLGSQALRNDGLIGYFAEDPAQQATYGAFYAVQVPGEVESDPYFKPIGDASGGDNYLQLRFVDEGDTPNAAAHQEQVLTMLVDPRAAVHAFTGILPVAQARIPSQFIKPALQNMAYLFRAGPFLTPPDAVQMPQPAEQAGVWSWFDKVRGTPATITPEDGKARFSTTAPIVKEGWLKFEPNPSAGTNTASK